MPSTNTDAITKCVQAFKKLNVNEQLGALAALYSEVKASVTSHKTAMAASSEVDHLIKQINDMRQENRLQFLEDVLSEKAIGSDETALDPHPSKAMLELLPGGATSPIDKYNDMSINSRLTVWYRLGEAMQNQLPAIVAENPPSAKASELISSLKQCDFDQQIAFLNKVI
ncbi:MAG: orange carotenoid protein N-terminal domain-containing protein [Oculatellaceae cyanobacterium bins.114]|nr:orange carotenoid protein N-terminal domain-containing protein [Oculatellaceae cyanobacterium bins.114]